MKKIYLLLILLTFIVSSCQQEDYSHEEMVPIQNNRDASMIIKDVPISALPEGVQDFVEMKSQTKNKNGFNISDFAQRATEVIGEDGISTYTLAERNSRIKPSNKSNQNYFFDNLVIRFDEEPKIFVIRYEPTLEWQEGNRDFNDFSGIISMYSLQGEKINSIYDKAPINKEINKSAENECLWVIDAVHTICTGGYCRVTYHLKEYCTSTSYLNPDGGGGDPGEGFPGHEFIPTVPTEPGDNWDTGSGGNTTTTTPTGEEVKIVNYLQGQDRCVYNKLLGLNLFKETIGVFDNNDDYILNITYGDCKSSGADACADGGEIGNGIVTIIIESVGQGTLDLAASLLHEGIHAEIYKYVEEHRKGIDPSKRTNLLYYYFHYKAKNRLDLGTTEAQHQYMADNFVKPIARAIQQLDGFRYDLEHYMGFGWDGLRAYGYDGYYDEGEWVDLNKDESSDYYKTQRNVLETTKFPTTCEE